MFNQRSRMIASFTPLETDTCRGLGIWDVPQITRRISLRWTTTVGSYEHGFWTLRPCCVRFHR